jgi:hypothetical protein
MKNTKYATADHRLNHNEPVEGCYWCPVNGPSQYWRDKAAGWVLKRARREVVLSIIGLVTRVAAVVACSCLAWWVLSTLVVLRHAAEVCRP